MSGFSRSHHDPAVTAPEIEGLLRISRVLVDELAYLEYLWGIASMLVSPGKIVLGYVDEIG